MIEYSVKFEYVSESSFMTVRDLSLTPVCPF